MNICKTINKLQTADYQLQHHEETAVSEEKQGNDSKRCGTAE